MIYYYCSAQKNCFAFYCLFISPFLSSRLEKEQQEAIEHIDEVQNEIDRYECH